MSLSPLVSRYDQLIVDLDGCVYVGDDATPGAAGALAALREAGKRIAFVTNDPRRAGEDYVRKLWSLGVQASLGDVVTVGAAMQHVLAELHEGRTAFVIGTAAMHRHAADAGLGLLNGTDLASRAEVVIVAGTDDLTYHDMRHAVLALRRGADFLATSRDPTYPMPDGMWPGTGAILAAIEYASERSARIVGKPEPQLLQTALERLGAGRTLVIGDRLDADVEAATRAGLEAVLVLTGGTTAEEAAAAKRPRPLAVAESLASAIQHGS